MDHRSYVVHRPHEATRGAEAFSSDARLQVPPPGSVDRVSQPYVFRVMLFDEHRDQALRRKPTIASQPRTCADSHSQPLHGGAHQGLSGASAVLGRPRSVLSRAYVNV